MRNSNHLFTLFLLSALVSLPLISRGQTNLTTIKAQGSGSNWGQAIWVTNAPGTYLNTTPLLAPVAGNTYEEVFNGTYLQYGNINNTRLRNPTGSGTSQTFPGDSLTIDTNCEIRFKDVTGLTSPYPANFPGVSGNPGLILNGGLLDDGDNGTWNIQGSIEIEGPNISVLAPAANVGNPGIGLTALQRSMIIGGRMSGSGPIALILTPTNIPVLVTNGLNTFQGNWIIQEGWLIGTTPQCLGSANITVDPLLPQIPDYPLLTLESNTSPASVDPGGLTNDAYAILDFNYAAVCTGQLILTNGGLMNLHTNVIFGNLTIEGTTLANGTYTYNYLTNSFTNFLAGGSGSITIATPVAPPAPMGLSAAVGANSLAISWLPATTATGYIISRSAVSGGPYTQVGTTNSLTYIDSGLTQFQTYYYEIQATNAFGISTNSIEVSGTPSPPVTGVMTTVGQTSVGVSWSSYSGATGYTVERTAVQGGAYTILTNGTTSLNYTDSSVANGTLYYYVVAATLNTGGSSALSAQATALTYPSLPAITTDLYGTSGIFLQSSTPDPQTPSYVVNASTDGIHFSPLATLQGGTNNYLDSGLNEATEYYFDVQATNSSGMSAVSAVVSNAIPSGTISFAFGTGYSNAGNPASPVPPGYIQDIGFAYGDQGDGTYGWVTNTVSVASGWDMSAAAQGTYNLNNPAGDYRRDSFIHQTQDSEATNFAGMPASSFPFWAVSGIPNGVYQVRVVSGDATANNSVYQQTVNGVTTPAFTPLAGNFFAQWVVVCQVTNNTLTVAPANTNNDKLNYIDIYPAVLPVASFTLGPVSGAAPLAVNFTNNSTGAYTSDTWTFDTNGDTLVSTNQVVSFTYTNGGTYTVSLTVSNNFGNMSTYTLTNAVTATSVTPFKVGIAPAAGGALQVTWANGADVLLQATNLAGPWITNVGAASPFTVTPTNGQMYYRVQQP
ncbi:MAG TPA: PKD domain-containing protein [Verrucomicrobiae bacterium]